VRAALSVNCGQVVNNRLWYLQSHSWFSR